MDTADTANDHAQRLTDSAIASRVQYEGVSTSVCVDCDAEIPIMRQQLIPGVQRCTECAERIERYG